MSAERLSIAVLSAAKSTGGVGKFTFPVMLVCTSVPRDATSASDAVEKPSNGLIVFGFVVAMYPPISFFSYRFWGGPLRPTTAGFLTRLTTLPIIATALPNGAMKPNTIDQGLAADNATSCGGPLNSGVQHPELPSSEPRFDVTMWRKKITMSRMMISFGGLKS